MSSFLNWKIQKGILLSLFSFMGMATLLWVFPSKADKFDGNFKKIPSLKTHSTPQPSSSLSFEKREDFSKENQSKPIQEPFLSFFFPSQNSKKEAQFSFSQVENFQNQIGYSFSENSLSIVVSNRFPFQNLPIFFPSSSGQTFLNKQQNYTFQMNYQISPYLIAAVNLHQNTLWFSLGQEYSTLSTGIQIRPNPYFSTSFLTGETFLYGTKNRSQNFYLNYLENPVLESSERRNLFEFKTEIRPSKNLFFQTSIYNTEQLYDEINSSQGTKFVIGYGLSFLQLSLKYNYLSTQFFKNPRFFENNSQVRDAGGVGITIFLDKNKNLSLYLGNNYFNLFNSPRYEDKSSPLPYTTSYSASLRGKTLQRGFLFLNFRNQISKDMQYWNFGNLRIPFQNIYQDTATSLGLEIWF